MNFRDVATFSVLTLLVAISCFHASAEPSIAAVRPFLELDRNSRWEEVGEVALQFPTFHPQGMTRVGEHFYLSSVEVVHRGRDEGVGHLFEVDDMGRLLRSIRLGDGAMYHPGGIDFDGHDIWVSVAEYRPDSRSIVYTVDPETLHATEVFRFEDHLGAIVHDRASQQLIAVSWGSRRIYRWYTEETDGQWRPVNPDAPETILNPAHYIDYQDMQLVPDTPYLLCSGIANFRRPGKGNKELELGGIDLLYLVDLKPAHMLPISLWTDSGLSMMHNPFYLDFSEGRLRLFVVPEDGQSTLYTFAPRRRR